MMKTSSGYKRGSKCVWLVPPLLFLIAAIILLAVPLTHRLAISTKEGKLLFCAPIAAGEEFRIRYTHSVNRSPVIDTIEWTGDEMMVRESWFKTFGAGIPIPADGIGKELVKVDGGYVLTGIDKPQQSFLLMTEEIPDHHLLYRGREIPLNALNGIGRMLKFEVKCITFVQAYRYDG